MNQSKSIYIKKLAENPVAFMNSKIHDFLTERDRRLLLGQNMTVHLFIFGETPIKLQLDVVNGDILITEEYTRSPNIHISFNESILGNLMLLKQSSHKLILPDILSVNIHSDNTCDDLAIQLLNQKLDDFVNTGQLNPIFIKPISTAVHSQLRYATLGKLTSMIGGIVDKFKR